MHGTHVHKRWRPTALMITTTLILGGCLSNEKTSDSTTEAMTDNRITGSVGDGPVANASMRILKNDGTVLSEFVSDSLADYDVTVRTKGANYPLTIEARDGTDLVTNTTPDMTMYGIVAKAGNNTVANVNPFSTFASELARNLPDGMTSKNFDTAEQVTVALFNSGLSTLDELGPATTDIDAGTIAEIIKASETLAEIFRRTRDYRQIIGDVSSANQVVRELAADALDNFIDGQGGALTNARTAAVSTVVSAQVLLESMSNELHVNGVDATAAMTSAMERVLGTTPTIGIEDQTVTSEMLGNVRVGLAAAYEVTSDPKIAVLQQVVDGMQAGMDYVLVRSLLPDDYRQTLDSAIMTVATGDIAVVNTVNSISRSGGGEPPANQAPVISGTPPTSVAAGSSYAFLPTASDPDGDSLAYIITGKPAWASFNTSTGRLSGSPTNTNAGTYSNIVIQVTDGQLSASLPAFSITVNAVNGGPSISGNPATSVNANTAYSFTPTASDPNGDTLTFSISNKPSWASFNSSTGRLSGTPADAAVGFYSNIRITVSDGQASASLGPFSITVNAISLGSVTLNWTPPTENEDGSALVDLAGYRLYWGTTPGVYTDSVTLSNPGMTSYVVENLAPGTYEFVATSFNAAGTESAYSNPATRTVN